MADDRTHNRIVWIDCEMTGLDIVRDSILEIAVLVTDNSLEIIAEGPDLVIHASQEELERMDDWCKKHHGESGLTAAARASKISIQDAENQVLEFLKKHCDAQKAPLAGNSVYQDRAFLRVYMPRLEKFLHYRTVDVSSVKELVRRWYPKRKDRFFDKSKSHRALEDIRESIAELAHYKKNFFISA